MKISACLIVRDEEKRLGQALASLNKLPGLAEVVVLDTGSRDASVTIAKAAGARVVEEPWRDDFSLHRNRCAELASHDWIFVLDGDEELVDCGDLAEFIAEPSANVAGVATECHYASKNGRDRAPHVEVLVQGRLYDRRKARWEFAVHNQLVGDYRTHFTTARIVAHYDGNLGEALARRAAVVHRHHEREPLEPHWLFCLAQCAMQMGELSKVDEYCHAYSVLAGQDVLAALLACWRAQALVRLGRVADAVRVVNEARVTFPDHADLAWLDVAFRTARWQQAIAAAARCWPGLPCSSAAVRAEFPQAGQALGLVVGLRGG